MGNLIAVYAIIENTQLPTHTYNEIIDTNAKDVRYILVCLVLKKKKVGVSNSLNCLIVG